MTIRRSFAKKAPPRCNRHGDSCDNDSVAADNGQKRSIDAGDDDAAEDTAEDTDNADNSDNSRRYADEAAQAKAEADKEVGRGDAEVPD
jgi:hypothetical protein